VDRRSRGIVRLAAALLLAGCAVGAPLPEATARPRMRLLPAGFDRVWETTLALLEERELEPEVADREEGRIQSGFLRRRIGQFPASREQARELQRIADLEPARRLGMESVSEYQVQYDVRVAPLENRSARVEIAASIWAIDRSEVIVFGPGLYSVVPRRYELRSKGVLERELLAAIGERLFLGEEMLYHLGELGKD
jgi:hypothetical protein